MEAASDQERRRHWRRVVVAIFTSMWNHAPRMEQELRRVGVAWPRLAPRDAADLVAFLLVPRTPISAVPGAPR